MLAGIRVLDLTQYLSGPSATRLLAAMGADVIKAEPGPDGDPCRAVPAFVDGRSGFFVQQNRGKRSICVDFADPAGHELLRELALASDVVVENFGPGVLEKRRLDYASLSTERPDLILASISAFGKGNSLSHLPGYDIVGQAYAGVMHVTGEPDGPPLPVGTAIADCTAGLMAFGLIGHALFHRDRTGEGQHLDVSLVEPLLHMQALAVQVPSVLGPEHRQMRRGSQLGVTPPTGSYQGPEGYVAVHLTNRQWDRFQEAVTGSGIETDPRFADPERRLANSAALASAVEAWMQTFPTDRALLDHLEAHRCPAAPVLDVGTAAHDHPWYRERGAIVEVDDPLLGRFDVPGFPGRAGALPTDADNGAPAPHLGEHTDEVLVEVLSYGEARVASLRDAGTVR